MLLYTHRYFMWYIIITEWTIHDIFQVSKHYKRVTRKNETNDRK